MFYSPRYRERSCVCPLRPEVLGGYSGYRTQLILLVYKCLLPMNSSLSECRSSMLLILSRGMTPRAIDFDRSSRQTHASQDILEDPWAFDGRPSPKPQPETNLLRIRSHLSAHGRPVGHAVASPSQLRRWSRGGKCGIYGIGASHSRKWMRFPFCSTTLEGRPIYYE